MSRGFHAMRCVIFQNVRKMNKLQQSNEDDLSFRGREHRHPAPTRAEARRQHVLGYVSNATYYT